jgi:hypothetical protein
MGTLPGHAIRTGFVEDEGDMRVAAKEPWQMVCGCMHRWNVWQEGLMQKMPKLANGIFACVLQAILLLSRILGMYSAIRTACIGD